MRVVCGACWRGIFLLMSSLNVLKRTLCATTLTAVVLMGTGCASIVHGGARKVEISTVPAGAKATITKAGSAEVVSVTTTPCTVSLDPKRGYFKGQSYLLKLELAGHQPVELALEAKLSGWYFGNIVFGGLIGMLIVDPLTGSMYNIAPEKLNQSLTPAQTSMIKNGDGFVVVLASEITDAQRTAMVKIN